MFFKKKVAHTPSREWKELLRENLNTVAVDMFSSDDPILSLGTEERKIYLKKFHDLIIDKTLISRLKYLVNLQARMTLRGAKNGEDADMAGAMNINGLCVAIEDIERLATMYVKENAGEPDFNKFDVI